ncbi:hypothetical protein ABZV64_13845 [Streptomyces sp. NPDC004959]|uniref:hypothetical protein n=1 Tax=Streptomyces sp. NPDC004959 TaxID=3154673 RepID=UPI0033A815B8
MEPLTEHRLVSGPVVYGFLRLIRVPRARQNALAALPAEYCRTHGLRLSGLFTDREATGAASAAFNGLLDALALPDVYGVVVPAMSHLGPKAVVVERGRRIESAGARLSLVRRPHPTTATAPRSGPVNPRAHFGTTRVVDATSLS